MAKEVEEKVSRTAKPEPTDKKPKEEGETEAAALAHRTQAQKSRFVKKISSEAEVIISSPGIFIGKTSRRLVLREARRNVLEQPFSSIRHITITTNGVSLSSDVIHSCVSNKVPMAFLTPQGVPYAILQSPTYPLGEVSLQQIRLYETEKGFGLAKRIVIGKSKNQMNVLKFYCRHRTKTDLSFSSRVKESLAKMEKIIEEILGSKMDGSYTVARDRLFTAEARISGYYWDIIKMLLPSDLGFVRRDKKGAQDVVNCMLNYGYGILYQRIYRAALTAGLNPQISFLHAFQDHHPTLVYDLIEEFRQAIVDRPLFSLMTKGTRYKELKIDKGTGLLNNFTKTLTVQAVLTRLSTLISFRGTKMKAEDIIQAQTISLAQFMKGKQKYRPFIATY